MRSEENARHASESSGENGESCLGTVHMENIWALFSYDATQFLEGGPFALECDVARERLKGNGTDSAFSETLHEEAGLASSDRHFIAARFCSGSEVMDVALGASPIRFRNDV